MKIGIISFLAGGLLVFVGVGLNILCEMMFKGKRGKTIDIITDIFSAITSGGIAGVFFGMIAILVSAIYWYSSWMF